MYAGSELRMPHTFLSMAPRLARTVGLPIYNAVITLYVCFCAEEDWSIVEYKCFAVAWTHGHLAMSS